MNDNSSVSDVLFIAQGIMLLDEHRRLAVFAVLEACEDVHPVTVGLVRMYFREALENTWALYPSTWQERALNLALTNALNDRR